MIIEERSTPMTHLSGTDYLTIQEAADYLKVSVSTIRRLITAREIITTKVGRLVRIPKVELDKYLTRKTG